MIKQKAIGLNSRSEANPYNEEGFLPLITAPMYSVVDETNYQTFLDNKIQVCLPRNVGGPKLGHEAFLSYSLIDFVKNFCNSNLGLPWTCKVCIDTANGNIPALHEAIRIAKEIHEDKLVIMAGNVASVKAFVELARTGVDYIRVGIGGGGGCNTTSNTGVGQENLKDLIRTCKYHAEQKFRINGLLAQEISIEEYNNISKVKIVADGISSWVNHCTKEYGYNDNGYAAINELLFAGADLVMVGKLFAQCLESAGEKRTVDFKYNSAIVKDWNSYFERCPGSVEVKYSGMSTHQEQNQYRNSDLKPSEGSVSWIPVRFLLNEWILGNESQDTYPYLMGWVNSIKSAMAYCNKKSL